MTPISLVSDRIQRSFSPINTKNAQNEAIYVIPYKEVNQAKTVSLHLGFLDASANEDGYYVIPNAKVCFLTNFTRREDVVYTSTENIMPIVGTRFADKALLVIVEGMRYDYQLNLEVKNGKYSITLSYDLTKIDLYEDICLRVITLTGENANYSGMARMYRDIMAKKMDLIPLAERAKSNPVLAYGATDMPVVRVRMAWKPVPTPVLEQTLETEPPMHVACTFADVELLISSPLSPRKEVAPRQYRRMVSGNFNRTPAPLVVRK